MMGQVMHVQYGKSDKTCMRIVDQIKAIYGGSDNMDQIISVCCGE